MCVCTHKSIEVFTANWHVGNIESKFSNKSALNL